MVTLAHALRSVGADCRIFAPDSIDMRRICDELGVQRVSSGPDASRLPGKGKRSRRFLRLSRAVRDVALGNPDFRRVLRDFPADLVIARNLLGVMTVTRECRRAEIPLIWDVGIETRKPGATFMLHRALRHVAGVIVQGRSQVCEIFGAGAERSWPGRFHVVTPGIVHLDPTSDGANGSLPVERSSAYSVIHVGSISSRKNQLGSLEAFATALRNGGLPTDSRLIFAGNAAEPDYASRVEERARELSLGERVEFLGWRNDVPRLMAASDLVILPSFNEGVPNAIQEAMFLGIPVIASNTGGIPDIVEHGRTGWLVPPSDTAALAERIGHAASHPEETRAQAERAAAYAREHFSIDGWAGRYSRTIQEILDRHD